MKIRVKCYLTVEADDNDDAFEQLGKRFADLVEDEYIEDYEVCEDDEDYEVLKDE